MAMNSNNMEHKGVGETEEIHVGVLFSQSGPMAVAEQAHLQGTLLAIEEINERGDINNRKIVPIIEEPASNELAYRQLANKILSTGDVCVIFGCGSSAYRKAVLPVIERKDGVLFYPSFYEGFEYCPNVIYTGPTPNQTVIPLAEYLFNHFGHRFYLVGSDYIYPREINRIVQEFLDESGGSVEGTDYVTLGSIKSDFDTVCSKIVDAQPDVILSTVVGSDTIKFYESFLKAGLSATDLPIASLTTSEAELNLMIPEARGGHITAASYFHCVSTPANQHFLNLYKKKFGDSLPNWYAETAYLQVHLFAQAAKNIKEIEAEPLIEALLGSNLEAPQGKVTVDSSNNHLFVQPRIGRTRQDGGFDIIWEASEYIKPDPYLIAYERSLINPTHL